MRCLVPGAQLLVMELEFPKIWMGNQRLRFLFPLVDRKKSEKKIPPVAQMWRLTEIKHWIEGLFFFYLLWDPPNCEDGSGDTPSIYRLWSRTHVHFPINNQCVSRSHQVCQLLPLQHQHIQFTEKSVVNLKKKKTNIIVYSEINSKIWWQFILSWRNSIICTIWEIWDTADWDVSANSNIISDSCFCCNCLDVEWDVTSDSSNTHSCWSEPDSGDLFALLSK